MNLIDTGQIYDLLCCQKRNLAISGSTDGRVKIFDMTSFLLLKTIKARNADVSFLCCDVEETLFAFIDNKKIIYVYSLLDGTQVAELQFENDAEIVFMCFFEAKCWNGQVALVLVTRTQGVFVLSQKAFIGSFRETETGISTYVGAGNASQRETVKENKKAFLDNLKVRSFKSDIHQLVEGKLREEKRENLKKQLEIIQNPRVVSLENPEQSLDREFHSLHFYNKQNSTGTKELRANQVDTNSMQLENTVEIMSDEIEIDNCQEINETDRSYLNENRVFRNLNDNPQSIYERSRTSKPVMKSKINEDFEVHAHFPVSQRLSTLSTRSDLEKHKHIIAAEFVATRNVVVALTEASMVLEWDLNEYSPLKAKSCNPSCYFLNDGNSYESFDVIQSSGQFLFMSRLNHCFYARQKNGVYLKILDEKYKKINPKTRERSQTSASNELYSMVAVNVVDKNVKEGMDAVPFNCEIFVYFRPTDERVLRRFVFDSEHSKFELNSNIYVIESSKSQTQIFVSGDSEGTLVVWDVSIGQQLYVFRETCDHIGLFNTTNPILDIKFLEHDSQILVSTTFGALGLYANGAPEKYQIFPREQFFSDDYVLGDEGEDEINRDNTELKMRDKIEMYLGQKYPVGVGSETGSQIIDLTTDSNQAVHGKDDLIFQLLQKRSHLIFFELGQKTLCSSQYQSYFIDPSSDLESIETWAARIFKTLAETVDKNLMVMEKESKQTIEFQEQRFQKFLGDFSFPFSVPELQFLGSLFVRNGSVQQSNGTQTEFQGIKDSRISFGGQTYLGNVAMDQSSFSRRTRTRGVLQNKLKMGYNDVSNEEEDISVGDVRQTSRGVAETRVRKASISFQQSGEAEVDNSGGLQSKNKDKGSEVVLGQLCYFCDTGLVSVSCSKCPIAFDNFCREKYAVKRQSGYLCPSCCLRETQQTMSAKRTKVEYLRECNRNYGLITKKTAFNCFNKFPFSKAELGVLYFFIPQAFCNFINYFRVLVDFPKMADSINQILKIKSDFLVKVKSFEFKFPGFATKNDLSHFCRKEENNFFVFQNLELEILEKGPGGIPKVISVSFCFPNSLDLLFLIPETIYRKFAAFSSRLKIGEIREFNSVKHIIKNTVKNNGSLYNSIELIDVDSNLETRLNYHENVPLLVSPWDLDSVNDNLTENTGDRSRQASDRLNAQRIKRSINQICGKFKDRFKYFLEEVDKDEYTDYLCYVPVECNVSFILKRLENGMYTSVSQIIRDFELIYSNACLYNSPENEVAIYAAELLVEVKTAMKDEERAFVKDEKGMVEEMRIGVRRRKLNLIEKNEEDEEEEEQEEEILAFERLKKVKF